LPAGRVGEAEEYGDDGTASRREWPELGEPAHLVQFYDDDAFLLDAVAEFAGGALDASGAAIVIATPKHREGIAERLQTAGVDLAAADARGRYVPLDAAETLEHFMVGGVAHGMPDPERFEAVVGRAVAGAGKGGRHLRAFGEMVALLVDEGNPTAAVRLEQLWNDLGQRQRFALFCAYPMDCLGGEDLVEVVEEVCAAHTSVIPAESYSALPTLDRRLRAVATLQQKAQSLAAEIAERQRAEEDLRRALAERDRLLEAEQAARAKAEAALRVRDEFLSTAAHELKTPLTSLLGHAQLVLRRYEREGQLEPEQVTQALATIRTQGSKLSRLVSTLMDVSRLEAAKLTLEQRPTNLVGLVEEIVSAARVWSERHTITLAFHLPAPNAAFDEALVDPLRIEQVFNNLLENAVKYSPDGGEIEVALAQPDQAWMEISVRDHGPGIPPEQRDHIFERFYQAHADGYRSGMGLGLYLSREIVLRHGGDIRAEFPPDGGTRFLVRLPVAAARQPNFTVKG
jgi:signal transduction histidine kinase